MTCKCHSDAIYAGLVDCSGCHHRSYDLIAQACERRKCGYAAVADPKADPDPQENP